MMRREKLIQTRLSRGWSQEAVAAMVQVGRNTYSDWEAGKRQPYPISIKRLCDLFGLPAHQLDLGKNQESTAMNVAYADALSRWAESPLQLYATGIATCRDLYFDGQPRQVEALLPLYALQIGQIAEQSGPLQQPAARLASQAYQLTCELAYDREDYHQATVTGQKAVQYAELADDANLHACALISLAALNFHRKFSGASLASYQRAALLEPRLTPLVAGRIQAGLAEVYGMRHDLQNAMHAMGRAYELYPPRPEDDPAYPFLRASRYSLYVYADCQTRIFLNQPKEAEAALIALGKEQNSDADNEPITRLDLLYYQSDIARHAGDLHETIRILSEAGELAKQLGSLLYFHKLLEVVSLLQQTYPQERTVLALEEAFQPWQ